MVRVGGLNIEEATLFTLQYVYIFVYALVGFACQKEEIIHSTYSGGIPKCVCFLESAAVVL
jgi:hypothetical protein